MRRITITLSAALMLLVFAPAGALARHHRNARPHHARHARLERFGDTNTTSTPSGSADNAGTVKSFTGGVLMVTLKDGSTVSGAVTRDTELECTAPQQGQTVHADGDRGGGDQSGDGDNGGSGDNQTSSSGDQSSENEQDDAAEQNEAQAEDQNGTQAEDQNENEAANENENEAENSCSSASLSPGTVVREAELRISSAGSLWKKVELEH